MQRNRNLLLLLIILFQLPSVALSANPHSPLTEAQSSQIYFEENRGQFEEGIAYQSFVNGIQVRFLDAGISYAMIHEVDVPTPEKYKKYENYRWAGEREPNHEALVWNTRFVGISDQTRLSGQEQMPGEINYIKGDVSGKWVKNAHRFRELWYYSLYEGIDLRYYGTDEQQIKYDFILKPYADIDQIRMQTEGVVGIELNAAGECIIHTLWGTVTDAAPYAWQLVNGEKNEVQVRYSLGDENTFGFSISGYYDPSLPLVIDPLTLNWSTFLHASTSDDYVIAVNRDSLDYVYMTGYTKSLAFPITPGVYQNIYGGGIDCFVTKMDPNGVGLIFSTYVGGSDWELPYAIGVTQSNEPIISGFMNSNNYPVTPGALQLASGGGLSEGFVTKLSADGADVIYSSYFGGIDRDYIYDMVLGPAGEAYLTGYTLSYDFPLTTGSYSNTLGGNGDIFVAKLNSDGNALTYSTLISGTNYDIANTIAINSDGEAFVAGNTGSSDLPASGSVLQSSPNFSGPGMPEDAFILKLSADGSALKYLTYLGGSDSDVVYGLVINSNDEVFVTGVTFSANYPVSATAYQTGPCPGFGMGDLFVTRLDNTASAIIYSTYLGGSDVDFCKSIRINNANEAHILGATRSSDFPVTTGSAGYTAMYDITLSVLSDNGSSILHSAMYGGSYNEYPRASGSLYLKGNRMTVGITTHSPDMPMTAGTFQGVKTNGTADAPWVATVEVGTVLPVLMASVTAKWEKDKRHTTVHWQVNGEKSPLTFFVERKTAEGFWTEIGRKEGNPAGSGEYFFRDEESVRMAGKWLFYRISYQTEEGDRYISGIAQVLIPEENAVSLSVFPNPAADLLKIEGSFPPGQVAQLEIVNMAGQAVYRNTQITEDMVRQLNISSWASGFYYVKLSVSGQSPVVERLLVE
ncbi:MAG: T9SS type A sorting domain-containing protein [Bacteroidia bacterium]|nr:T9SS type A sorting domain-containing protein [Bacteroidia bacterium]